jgi:pimeloyl-ACP methyl ester carboxylesterase
MKRLFQFLVLASLLFACSESTDIWGEKEPEPFNESTDENARKGEGLDQDRYIVMKNTGLKVHYRIMGKGPIRMVWVPGWTNPNTVFTKQYEYFRDRAKCIYIDLPGHGLSDAPMEIEYTMELMADAIYEVVRKEGFNRFVAIGFSMGPVVLGKFEQKYPDMITELINIDGGFNPWPPIGDPDRDGHIAWREGFHNFLLGLTPQIKQDMLGGLLGPNAPQDLVEWGQYFIDYPNWLLANIWYNFTAAEVNNPIGWSMPIMCIYTMQLPDEQYLDEFFPDSEDHLFENSGHVVQWEWADDVNELIDDFIDRPGNKY